MVSPSAPQPTDKLSRPSGEPPVMDSTYRALVERAPDAIVILDSSGRCLDVTAAASLLIAVPREHLIGRNLREFLRAENLPCGDGFHDDVSQILEPNGEWQAMRGDGRLRILEYSATRN